MTSTPRPTRRTVVRGAAWATPAVALAATAPAYAVSPCTPASGCPNLAFGAVASANSATAGNGWSWAVTASPGGWNNSNPMGFQPAITSGTDAMVGKGPYFAATSEPDTDNRVLTLTQTGQPALKAGCPYTISFGVVTYTTTQASDSPLEVRALVGTTSVASYSTGVETTQNNQYFDRGMKSFTFTAPSSSVVSLGFYFGRAGGAEDIKLYNVRITCS